MKSIIVSGLGIILATTLTLAPGRPSQDGLVLTGNKTVEKVQAREYKEVEVAQVIPTKCSDYLHKYGWNQSVAYNVMMVESGNKPTNLNDNPNTGDYSIGCFQINLLGGNLMSKYGIMQRLGYTGAAERAQMTEWLWNPSNNVAVAWELYKGSGWAPWSFMTCKKVACY